MKNFRKIFFVAMCMFVLAKKSSAQFDVFKNDSNAHHSLLRRDVDTTGEIPKVGPNRLFFAMMLIQLGETPGPQNFGAQTHWWSGSLDYGVRMKLKLWSWEALTMDLGYRYDRFSMRMDAPRLLPFSDVHHQREKIVLHNFSGAFCDRINFGRRGNIMGTWLDLGVFADWAFATSDVYVDQYYLSNSPSGYHYKSKTRINRLPYLDKMNYGFTARFGGDYGGVFVLWRTNEMVKKSSYASSGTTADRDLPKLTIGIEFYNWD